MSEPDGPGMAQGDDEIIVTGQRLPGSVPGDIPPELQLTPADIRAYGVSSISDLLAELSSQTASGRGRDGGAPVVLLNARRVSSFAEIRDIPTEAIQRVEIMPEEVALRYGYRADQKVVNIILRRRFNAVTAELEGAMPTAGGQTSFETDNSLLRINENGRLNLALKYERSSALTEDERDIIPDSPRQPYDSIGNVAAPLLGAEIDPALSALGGRTITVAGVPDAAAAGAQPLGAFTGARRVTDAGAYRTLLPRTDALTANAVLARTIFGNVSATLNTSFSYNESDSAQGLARGRIGVPAGSPFSPFAGDTNLYRYLEEADPLLQASRDITGHVGFTMNGGLKDWLWSLTGNYDRSYSRTLTDNGVDLTAFQARVDALDPLVNPFAPIPADLRSIALVDRARSVSGKGDLQLVANGSLATLPAGKVSATVKLGGEMNDFSARSTRSGILATSDFSRDIASGQVSLDIPLASRKRGFLAAVGELSANFNIAYDRLSDFGTLRTLGYGLNWSPIKAISLIASVTEDEGAPSVQQLGNPLITISGARIFDYVRGETVDITRLSGGNPALSADDRRVIKLGATIKPLVSADLSIVANYTNSRTRNPIASFPTATAAIEAAFPERFTRDASGQLIRIDSRPINFSRQNREELRWGINFSRQLSAPPRPSGGERPAGDQQPSLREMLPPGVPSQQAAPGGTSGGTRTSEAGDGDHRPRGGFGPGGGGFRRGPGGRGTRLQLAVYHTVHLRDDILIRPGGPELDLLDGDAIGSSGGQPKHEVEAQAGLTHNGFGARLRAAWQSATHVDGGAGGSRDLRFSSLATLNLRLFANLGQQESLVKAVPFLRGSRLSLSVTNLFDERIRVRDMAGATPISFQPGYLDPLGRSVRVSFRKLFSPPRPRG